MEGRKKGKMDDGWMVALKEGWMDGWKVDGWMSLRVDVKTYGEYCTGI